MNQNVGPSIHLFICCCTVFSNHFLFQYKVKYYEINGQIFGSHQSKNKLMREVDPPNPQIIREGGLLLR